MADNRIPTPAMGTTPATSPGHEAIADALSAALYCLQAVRVPNHIWLAAINARRALVLLDGAYAEIEKIGGAA